MICRVCNYIIFHQGRQGHANQSNLNPLVQTALRWRSTDLLSTSHGQKEMFFLWILAMNLLLSSLKGSQCKTTKRVFLRPPSNGIIRALLISLGALQEQIGCS